MLCLRRIEKDSALCQILQYLGIAGNRTGFDFLLGRFAAHSRKFAGFGFHLSCTVHHLYERSIVFTSDSRIVFTERGSDMYDTGTVGHGYVFITVYEEGFLMLLLGFCGCTFVKRFVFLIFKVGTFVSFKNFICLAVSHRCIFCIAFLILCGKECADYGIQKRYCHIVGLAVNGFYFCILIVRVYAKTDVRRQCPGGCGPCKEVCIFIFYFETNDCGTILNGLIALCHFLCGKRGSASRAVGYNFKAFV